MKKLFNWAKKKIIDFLKWLWQECKDWRTFVLLVIVCVVIGFPVWGGYLLYFITGWEWTLIVATALLAFWWLPGAPYFAVCVAVTLAIKRFFERRKEKLLELIEDIKDGPDDDKEIIKDAENGGNSLENNAENGGISLENSAENDGKASETGSDSNENKE